MTLHRSVGLVLTVRISYADDVIFVLEHCDTDGDRTIDRDELLPMLAEWKARQSLRGCASPPP